MIEYLLELDRNITLSLNGSSSLYADGLMMAIINNYMDTRRLGASLYFA